MSFQLLTNHIEFDLEVKMRLAGFPCNEVLGYYTKNKMTIKTLKNSEMKLKKMLPLQGNFYALVCFA